jgi:amino acid adenylation domain-containing protein
MSSPPARSGIADGVLAQIRRNPDAQAVLDGDHAMTYGQLAAASAAVADGLRAAGVRPGQPVAISLPRSWQLVSAMLGILRLGSTVVSLDAASPVGRQRHMLADSASVALIHQGDPPAGLAEVRPVSIAELLPDQPPESSPATLESEPPADLALLFYTSGTTGRPKGVQVRDAGVLRLAQPGYLRLAEGARYACLSNPAFDALSFEVWTPLLTGGCCVILDPQTVATPVAFANALRSLRIDAMFVTAALFNAVVEQQPDCFSTVAEVLVGGEQLNAQLIRAWYAANPDSSTVLHNGYGPTEATTFALSYPIPRDFAADLVPIGRPLPGTEALAVFDGRRLAEPEEVAELYLGGDCLAAGYQNLAGETADRFVRLPWHDGGRSRYYRTGDLVRSDAEGLISYVGRTDRQVKVRGFRIEPGEVERQLLTHPSIRQAYCCTRRDPERGSHELLAYLVLGGPLSYPELDQHLASTLPTYMRPHRSYLVEQLPRTANGKVDQDALLALDVEPWRPAGAEPAGTGWQREVADLVAEVLGGPAPGLDQGFLAAGGDSLSALRLRFAIARRWNCQLPQGLVLRSDLAGLAQAIDAARSATGPSYPPPPEPGGADSAPATSEQQRLWLLQQQHPQSAAYNVGFAFQLTGSIDTVALRAALAGLVARHPALRTGFATGPDGLRQLLGDPYDPWLDLPRGSDWRAEAQRLFAIPFDLAEPRMFQAGWLPSADGGVLLLRLHHIAVDGWSLNLLFEQLSADYLAVAADSATVDLTGQQRLTPLDYADGQRLTPLDYAAWQADWFDRPAYREQRAALCEHYADLEETAEPLPVRQPDAGAGLLTSTIDPARCAQLDRLGVEFGLTRFQLLLGVFSWALYAVTGRARPLVASPVAGRPVQEFEASVGMFANTMLLPLTVSPRDRLREQLLRQAAGVRAVLDRQDVVLADVLDDHDFRTEGPLFDFLFVLDNTDFDALRLPGCRPVWLAPAEAKCALTLSVIQRSGVEGEGFLDCLWEYAGDRLEPAEVAALSDLFGQGLDRLIDRPDSTVAELVAPYRSGLPDPGRGAPLPLGYQSIAEGFAAQVARTPDAIALVAASRQFSYAELDGQAQLLADQLRARYQLPAGDQPCQIALHFQPSAEHIVALLALARLDITAVPVDPSYPPALRQLILDQARPLCMLTADAGADDPHRHQVVLADAGTAVGWRPDPESPAAITANRPLYTLFTSGSTGTPKGVQVPNRTLCNLLQWQRAAGGLPDGAVTQQFSMLSFDVSFQEIFGTLCGGGTLHLIRPGWRHDMPTLLEYLETAGIERIHLPYVALQLLAEHGAHLGSYPSRLRDVVTAGEQLLCTEAVRGWFAGMPGARLFNHYGPSETHVVSGLCLAGDPASWPDRPPIGSPVAGAWLRVVDEADQPVPPDCPGELLIGGLPSVPCYLDDPAANAASFVELPDIGRCYRSGDLAKFDRHGLLHFIGRDDQQVKLSGHRLELGQVEAALAAHPAVGVAVVVRDGEQLVACLEFRGEPPAPDQLAAHLAERLPAYVRVDRYRQLAELPRTASGKLDRRRALEAPGSELTPRPPTAPELTEREAQLTALFQAVIGRPISLDQRFFDAGASSLGLMRFHLRATAELGVTLSIADLFEQVTIRRLARFLDGEPRHGLNDQTSDNPGRDEPIAVIGMAVRLPGADDLAAFAELIDSGGSGISYFEPAAGLVGARSQLADPLGFDAEHFGISRPEARLMDPQQRHLLMACVQALAHAGIANPTGAGLIASCGENTYFQAMLREADPAQLPDGFQLALHHDKDFLATKVAYQLGLTGPAFTVQAACASSLVAVHVAAGLLRQGDSELMLAGGVLVDPSMAEGYRYRPQHIYSPDGHCRSFSDDSAGTVGASGVGVVVLKPLRAAQRDGDTVYAVVTGSAVNNDGAGKLSYTAPALAGQREVIGTALRRSGRQPNELGYIEAHGTGTELGDPVEVGALRQAYQLTVPGGCALSSVKSQLGHLGAAAGVVGLIRASLAVYRGLIPPTIDFHQLNPRIGDDAVPFRIPTESEPWPAGRPRVAAVSSFGIGGTNAHLILEGGFNSEPPAGELDCLLLSASSAFALHADAGRIADYLTDQPDRYRQVLRHLQAGRPAGRWRAAAVCPEVTGAVGWLRSVAGLLVRPSENVLSANDSSADELVAAWLAGDGIDWPDGPAQPPWDFPPPAFALVDYDFARAPSTAQPPADSTGWPARLPESSWLHQPHWVRLARAGNRSAGSSGCLILLTAEEWPAELLQPLRAGHRRLVTATAAETFAELGPDRYLVDPADPASLARLLTAVAEPADWLHALPLAVSGPVDQASLDRARWACLDSTAALLQASAEVAVPVPRIWLLSQQAQPVRGGVGRPELGLLAGPVEVIGQEHPVRVRWLDLPDPDPAGWLTPVAALLSADPAGDRASDRLALRDGYWWRQALLPVPAPPSDTAVELPSGPAVYLLLGGTGGIGSTVAGWLLDRSDCQLILLSRQPELPAALADRADRIRLLPADLATEPIGQLLAAIRQLTDRLDGVVHAVGQASGSLIVRRGSDPAGTAKLRGALLMERLLAEYRPALALYCSSMSAQFGGAGQFDYAAGNGLLDGFAHYQAGEALRIGIDWDVWREVGMARQALPDNPRHQAHLATGLTVAEAGRLLDRAWQLGLPQLLVSTTDPVQSAAFYHPVRNSEESTGDPAETLAGSLRRWLGLTELDPAASLYELGADSLTLLDLVAEVHQRFGVELPLAGFSHRVSLAEVLDQLAEHRNPAPAKEEPVAVQVWQQGTAPSVLCLLHPVGGDIQTYRSLAAELDPRLTVCLIADPGLQQDEPLNWTLADRVERYYAALQGRFPNEEWQWRLAGWSFGGWLAVGLAAAAEAAGQPAEAVYLIDPPAPDAGPALADYQGEQLEAVFAHELAQDGPADRIGTSARAYAERLARCCRVNLASMADYRVPELTGTPSRLWLAGEPIPGLLAPAPVELQARQWQARLAGLASWQAVNTTHYGVVRPPHARLIAEAISTSPLPVLATR